MSPLRPHVLAARERLREGLEDLRQRHEAGCRARALCAAISDLRDETVRDLFAAALADVEGGGQRAVASSVALVAHSGYGRRDPAPYSDVDLMLLRAEGADRLAPLAERLWCDICDAGLVLGHSVRSAEEACRLSGQDPLICTALVESRFVAGCPSLVDDFKTRFTRRLRARSSVLVSAMEKARAEERVRYGETVYLLEPNVKRSRGGLRDVQLLRWVGLARYGTPEPRELCALGLLPEQDLLAIEQAAEWLLWLRNEMHFFAGRASDVLTRAEQVRIAQRLGYEPAAGMLPVERFMRDHFRHTDQVSHVVGRFLAKARPRRRLAGLATFLLGHRVEGGFRVGPREILATRLGRRRLASDLAAVMHLVDLANLYDKPIEAETWEVVRQAAGSLPQGLPPDACRHFLSLLRHPARLGELLRGLHEVGLLERFLPDFAHARGLLQFNQYHKYTVDEHSLRAVDQATDLLGDPGPLGAVYRGLTDKHVLHLALLIHDLGKGHADEHCDVGREIAERTAQRLGLPAQEAESLKFLVHKHLLMNHLAFRRDTSDEQLIVRFAVEVGSPELLRTLFVLTAADLGAVGPDNWTSWKAEVVTDLYQRAMQHLAGESPEADLQQHLEHRRRALLAWLGPEQHHPWFARQVASLPASYLCATQLQQIAADLRLLHRLAPGDVNAHGRYLPETQTVQYTVATSEDVTPGIFHKLTGALSSQGLQILSAQIHTLADRLVLDRFWVVDADYAGEPPPERLERVEGALVESLRSAGPPTFRRVWRVGGPRPAHPAAFPTRVLTDNTTSASATILDIFACDGRGLLYAIARTLFELGLSVWRAKIGTYLDQVVDVFYVTDQQGSKVLDPGRLQEIRRRLLEVIESLPKEEG